MGILLWPRERETARVLAPSTVEDLQLHRLCSYMAMSGYFKLSAEEICDFWTTEPDVILYRQTVLKDLLRHPGLGEKLEELLEYIDLWETHTAPGKRGGGGAVSGPPNMSEFSFLESYIERITKLSESFGGIRGELASEGMTALADKLAEVASSQSFMTLKEGFERLCGSYALPARVTIGFNLNRELKLQNYKLISLSGNRMKGKKITTTKTMATMLTQLMGSSVSDASLSTGMVVKRETSELRKLRQDIIFYCSALKLCRLWSQAGQSFCFPEILPAGAKAFSAEGMFNPLLLVNGKTGDDIVTNDIEFKKGGELLILTGANQGGKTVFLHSVALTQWLFQLGIAVPAKKAAISPCGDIITVFAPTAASASRRGLLAEEAGRIARAVSQASENALALFNEPLNATSPNENLHISREVLGAFKAAGVRGVWVTHLYELASDRERINELIGWGSRLGSIRIRVTQSEGGTRSTYKIVRGEPEFNSYAAEVLRRKGVGKAEKAAG